MLGSNPSADPGPKTEAGCPRGTPFRFFDPRDWDQSAKSRGSGGWPPAAATRKIGAANKSFALHICKFLETTGSGFIF